MNKKTHQIYAHLTDSPSQNLCWKLYHSRKDLSTIITNKSKLIFAILRLPRLGPLQKRDVGHTEKFATGGCADLAALPSSVQFCELGRYGHRLPPEMLTASSGRRDPLSLTLTDKGAFGFRDIGQQL